MATASSILSRAWKRWCGFPGGMGRVVRGNCPQQLRACRRPGLACSASLSPSRATCHPGGRTRSLSVVSHAARCAVGQETGASGGAAEGAGSEWVTVTLLPGNGIGPEVCSAVMQVFEAADVPVVWDLVDHQAQEPSAPDKHGVRTLLDPKALDSLRRNRVGLKGPFQIVDADFEPPFYTLRKQLDMFANVRPAKTMPGYATKYNDVDLVIIRENTEGEYAGLEHEIAPGVFENLRVITRAASERIARFAFEYAQRNGRRRVTACHKASLMKLSDGLFLDCCREAGKAAAAAGTGVTFDETDLDNAVLQLASKPEQFDVLLMPNLYGDIASDLAAGVVGGVGITPSANLGDDVAVFEAMHGTAPDLAGLDMANPTALLLSAVMMLRHMGMYETADVIESSVLHIIAEGKNRTADLGGTTSCSEFAAIVADEVVARMAGAQPGSTRD